MVSKYWALSTNGWRMPLVNTGLTTLPAKGAAAFIRVAETGIQKFRENRAICSRLNIWTYPPEECRTQPKTHTQHTRDTDEHQPKRGINSGGQQTLHIGRFNLGIDVFYLSRGVRKKIVRKITFEKFWRKIFFSCFFFK
jgi:hypothetical protein